jgi:hypothetical protein
MNAQNIAPCGINCSLCSAFSRKKDTCPGCNGIGTKPVYCRTCQIRFCSLKTAENEFCGSCGNYPCKRMKTLYKRYNEKYGVNIYENLETIRKKGIDKLIEEEEKKWRCSKCGSLLCMHKNKCPACGEINSHYTGTKNRQPF